MARWSKARAWLAGALTASRCGHGFGVRGERGSGEVELAGLRDSGAEDLGFGNGGLQRAVAEQQRWRGGEIVHWAVAVLAAPLRLFIAGEQPQQGGAAQLIGDQPWRYFAGKGGRAQQGDSCDPHPSAYNVNAPRRLSIAGRRPRGQGNCEVVDLLEKKDMTSGPCSSVRERKRRGWLPCC
ncbi:unnamed protein product [Miscanthus lutarioriparius]|uniref:Uncharacterized protein n=1 Tax=Miscanthus lutarioriparius TaxID=422564 RepID=A0A811PG64_9POAL|nr:unnamed protein product [Miscanthus lutarioriparius]